MNAGWHASRWASWSSKSVAGSAKLAAVGSTPMPSRYVASRPIENDAPAACVRGSLKGCIRNCSVSNPFRIACSADCAQTGLRCVFTIRRAGSSARHFGGQGPLRDSALPRDRPYAGKGAALVAGGSDQTDTRLRVPCPFAWRRLGLSRSPSAARLPARVPRATSSGPAGCEGRTRAPAADGRIPRRLASGTSGMPSVWRRSVRERITPLKRYQACMPTRLLCRVRGRCHATRGDVGVGMLALPRPKDGGCGDLLRRILSLWLLGRRRKRLAPLPWPPNAILWYVMVQAEGCGKAFSSVVETAVFRLRAQEPDTRTRGQRVMTAA